MNKHIVLAALAAVAGGVFAAEPAATALVEVDPGVELGVIKDMHAVNNGPSVAKPGGDQKLGNFEAYKAARIPFARTHDSINCVSGGAHCCDVNAIFPDFDADENDPKNYDFVFTDHYLDAIRRAGTEVFFRLGQTIEHGPKKYGVLPPKDFAKWARICEHIIRHYNEGWGWNSDQELTTCNIAWSNQFNIVYWEIWNEPDLDLQANDALPKNPRCWGGTRAQFFDFFTTVVKHLKAKFPKLKIGGPATAWNDEFGEALLKHCKKEGVDLDFYSWHIYSRTPEPFVEKAKRVRAFMDRAGYDKAESILNEWNYVKGWVDDWGYSLRCESGDLSMKGAAFIASVLCVSQPAPIDILMFYDAKLNSSMNNMFERITYWPLKGYYPFYAWSKMKDRGIFVASNVREGAAKDSSANTGFVEKKDKNTEKMFYACAAKGKDGSGAVLITRYSDDDNSSEIGDVTIRVKGVDLSKARCHMTDLVRAHTEIPLEVRPDGSAVIQMQPRAFALVEW